MDNINIGYYVRIASGDVGEVLRILEDDSGKVYNIRLLGDSKYNTRYIDEYELERVTEKELLDFALVLIYRLLHAIYTSTTNESVHNYIDSVNYDKTN